MHHLSSVQDTIPRRRTKSKTCNKRDRTKSKTCNKRDIEYNDNYTMNNLSQDMYITKNEFTNKYKRITQYLPEVWGKNPKANQSSIIALQEPMSYR